MIREAIAFALSAGSPTSTSEALADLTAHHEKTCEHLTRIYEDSRYKEALITASISDLVEQRSKVTAEKCMAREALGRLQKVAK